MFLFTLVFVNHANYESYIRKLEVCVTLTPPYVNEKMGGIVIKNRQVVITFSCTYDVRTLRFSSQKKVF